MRQSSFRATLVAAVFVFTAGGIVSAQNIGNNGQRITPNFKDARSARSSRPVAAATGKTIIPDPRIRAQVTMLSQTPMTPAASTRRSSRCCRCTSSSRSSPAASSGSSDANARQVPNKGDLSPRIDGESDE
jgi:hypothetical protein